MTQVTSSTNGQCEICQSVFVRLNMLRGALEGPPILAIEMPWLVQTMREETDDHGDGTRETKGKYSRHCRLLRLRCKARDRLLVVWARSGDVTKKR